MPAFQVDVKGDGFDLVGAGVAHQHLLPVHAAHIGDLGQAIGAGRAHPAFVGDGIADLVIGQLASLAIETRAYAHRERKHTDDQESKNRDGDKPPGSHKIPPHGYAEISAAGRTSARLARRRWRV